jgi:putative aminopeptidase FrvX
VVAYDLQPHMTITLDNVPTKNRDELGPHDTDLNRGPVIRMFDWYPPYSYGMFTHPAIETRLRQIAQDEKIDHQIDVVIGTYRRYSHSPVELGHLNDLRGGLRLLTKFIESVEKDPIQFGRSYS